MTSSTITLHYFKLADRLSSCGYGEFLNLLLKDAGVDYDYVRYNYDNWDNEKSEVFKNNGLHHTTLPLVEIDGKSYNKTFPAMRIVSKKLGKYMGANDEENYHLEVVADIIRDHFGTYAPLFRGAEKEKLDEHFEKDTRRYLAIYEKIYGEKEGPYVLGEEISYADFIVYHMLDDDNYAIRDRYDVIQKDYPNVARLIEAITKRPRLADYLTTLKSEKV